MGFIKYNDWIKSVPKAITNDTLWKMKVYRLSLFLGDIGWNDISVLYKDGRTKAYPINYIERWVPLVQT